MADDGRLDRERAATGEYADSIDPESALAAFDAADPGEPLGASEVADFLNSSRRTAFNKLDALVDDGVLATKKIGRSRVWWVSDADAGRVAIEPGDADKERARTALEAVRDGEGLDWSDDRIELLVPAVAAAAVFLGREGQAQKRDFLADVALDYPGDFKTDKIRAYLDGEKDRYRGGWWRDVVRPALLQYPEVTESGQTYLWHDAGDEDTADTSEEE